MCDVSSSWAIKKDSLFIVERANPEQGKKPEYFLRTAYKQGDTLLMKKIIDIDKIAADRQKKQMAVSPLYIENIGNYKFSYDSVPDDLSGKFNKEEKILAFRAHGLFRVYLTRNEMNGMCKIYASMEGEDSLASIQLNLNPEKPDFFLADVLDDDTPEIFIVRKAYLLNRYLRDIEIYCFSNTSKKAF